jgi:hypothetical protein
MGFLRGKLQLFSYEFLFYPTSWCTKTILSTLLTRKSVVQMTAPFPLLILHTRGCSEPRSGRAEVHALTVSSLIMPLHLGALVVGSLKHQEFHKVKIPEFFCVFPKHACTYCLPFIYRSIFCSGLVRVTMPPFPAGRPACIGACCAPLSLQQ